MIDLDHISQLPIYGEKHNYRIFTGMQKYHNFWKPVNFADMEVSNSIK
ncbi:MAG: hypothetical protein PVF60_06865 [Desulfobacterales bacterium]|jgi:hypothetical protein